MNVELIHEYALSKADVEEGFPFGEDSLVFKTGGKMFLLLSLESQPLTFNVKCDPDLALELRETYPENVLPGYHMSKKHWNTVVVDGHLSARQLQEFIDASYNLVAKKKK